MSRRFSLKGWRWDQGAEHYVSPSGDFTVQRRGREWELFRGLLRERQFVSVERTLSEACDRAEMIAAGERGYCDGVGGHYVRREVVFSTLRNGSESQRLCPECFKDALLDLVTSNDLVTIRLAGEGVYELL